MNIDNSILNDINCINNVKSWFIENLMFFSFNNNNIYSMNIRSINHNFDELVNHILRIKDYSSYYENGITNNVLKNTVHDIS